MTEHQPGGGQKHRLPQHHPNDLRALRTERDANADLPRPKADGIRNQAGKAGESDHQGRYAECAEQHGNEARGGHRVLEQFLQRLDVVHRLLGSS